MTLINHDFAFKKNRLVVIIFPWIMTTTFDEIILPISNISLKQIWLRYDILFTSNWYAANLKYDLFRHFTFSHAYRNANETDDMTFNTYSSFFIAVNRLSRFKRWRLVSTSYQKLKGFFYILICHPPPPACPTLCDSKFIFISS